MFEQLNALQLWDFWVKSFGTSKDGDDVLVIHAGQDLSHPYATLRFQETEYISCPIMFSHAQFREASADEVRTVGEQTEYQSKLFAVDTEVGEPQWERTYFIAAKAVEVEIGS